MKTITCIFNSICKDQVNPMICLCGQLIDRSCSHVIFTERKNGFDLEIVPDNSDCLFIL